MLNRELKRLRSSGLLTEYQSVAIPGNRYQGIPIFHSDRRKSQRTWARVYFVDCDEFVRLAGPLTTERCSDFQSELLGRVFFGEDAPLRWNMYLYFVYREACSLKQIARMEIESDTQYARKYVVPADALSARFALTSYSLQEKTLPEPEAAWQSILAPAGLSECLYDSKYSAFVGRYLQSDPEVSQAGPSIRNAVQTDDSLVVQRLSSLSVRQYRKAIFGDEITLPMKQVNIVEGENGTGKSSLVDAIEYAMTGSIKRFVDSNGDPHSAYAQVIAINRDGIQIALTSEGKPDIKSREQIWYHTPKTARKTTISRKFEQINRFSIESVFSMVYSQCRDKDRHLIDSITALCFDDYLSLMEKNWTTYLERFKDEWSEICERLDNACSDWNRHENRRKALVGEIQARQVNLDNLHLALFGIQPQHEDYYSRFEDFKLRFAPDIATLERLNSSVSLGRLMQYTCEQDQRLLELRAHADTLDSLELQREGAHSRFQALEDQVSRLHGYVENYTGLHHQILDCGAQLDSAGMKEDTLEADMSRLTVIAEHIERIYRKYGAFLTDYQNRPLWPLAEIVAQEQAVQIRLAQIREHLQNCIERAAILEAQMASMRRNIDALEEKQISVARIGESLVKALHASACPLCGYAYTSADELLRKIDDLAKSSRVPMHNQMLVHQMELDRVNASIKELERGLYEAQEQEEFLLNARNVCQECSASLSLETCIVVGDLASQLERKRTAISHSIEELSRLQKAYGQLVSAFQAKGIAKSSLQVYEQHCIAEKNSAVDKAREIHAQKELLGAQISRINKDILELGDVSNAMSRIEQENASLHALIDAIARMKDGGLLVTKDTDLSQLKGFLSQLDGAVAVTQQNKGIQDVQRYLAELDKTIITCKQMAKRCQVAVEALQQLRSLKKHAQSFVEDNLQEISMVFKKLHLPPEFSDLQVREDEIMIMRPGSGRPVRINEMSLGQKTSLALAIMFQMHMMGKNAPRILLLDEPIANLDDIHIMNLVDILRELTINGAQLFITTSNKEVARYFARKFAFLDDEVVYYSLKRKITNESVGVTSIEKKEIYEIC